METNGAPEGDRRVGADEKPLRLSEELAALRARFAEEPVRLRDVIAVLRGRAYLLLMILLALPFCTPIPMPGLSTPFGLVIALIAFRLALGQHPWLPDKILDRQLPPGFFGRVLTATARIIGYLEFFLRPRLTLLAELGFLRQLHALAMLLAALVLLLPLPIPFTNAFPAWVIVLMAGGLLERDGGSIAVGYATLAAGVGYFLFLGGAMHHLMDACRRLLGG